MGFLGQSEEAVVKRIVFVLDHRLHDYRVPVFDLLSKRFEVTVVHRGPAVDNNVKFSQVILTYYKLGRFEFIKGLSLRGYDVVVFMQNLRVLNIYMNLFSFGSFKLLYWGIGTSSSKGLGKEIWIARFLRNLLTILSDGLALYSRFPLPQYWGLCRKKIEVIGNSIDSPYSFDSSGCEKEFVLFIGSLDERKGLLDLLESFARCLVKNNKLRLVIVGDGPERERMVDAIMALGIGGNVEMLGRITCPSKKADIFAKAYFVVSPYQAGLSVVESLSFGVPFVTSKNAITGGEALSILHNVNGVLFESISELDDIILSFFDGRRDHQKMGHNAYKVYCEHLKFEQYVSRFNRLINKSLCEK